MAKMRPVECIRLIEVEGTDKKLAVWPYYFNLPLIHYFMHTNKLTIESFAKKLKVSIDELNNLLDYKVYCFSREIFDKLSRVMDCPIDYILLDDFLSFGKWGSY